MENAKIKVLRFDSEDVIATSSLCSRDGNALQLYAFGDTNEWCGWFIGESSFYDGNTGFEVFGDWKKCKDIFDNGTKSYIEDECVYTVATDEWYHFEDGTYYLCNNPTHQ